MSYIPKIKIEVSPSTHQELRELKERGSTFDEVIKKLLELSKGGASA